jgi:hypothetical protein
MSVPWVRGDDRGESVHRVLRASSEAAAFMAATKGGTGRCANDCGLD